MILACLKCSREIEPKAVGGGIFNSFPQNFRPEVDNSVISSVAVDNVSMDIHVKFGDSMSNGSQDIQGADLTSFLWLYPSS